MASLSPNDATGSSHVTALVPACRPRFLLSLALISQSHALAHTDAIVFSRDCSKYAQYVDHRIATPGKDMRSLSPLIAAAYIALVHSIPTSSSKLLFFHHPSISCSFCSDPVVPQNLTSLETVLVPSVLPFNASVIGFNNLIIENCEDDAQIHGVNEAITATKAATLSALTDSKLGINSPYGFRAMFKSNEATEAVSAILEGMTWYRGRRGLNPNPSTLAQPRLACVTEDTAEIYASLHLGYDPWQRCLVGTPRRTPIAAFYAEGTAYIFICPAFFIQEPQPDTAHCPAIHNNRFVSM